MRNDCNVQKPLLLGQLNAIFSPELFLFFLSFSEFAFRLCCAIGGRVCVRRVARPPFVSRSALSVRIAAASLSPLRLGGADVKNNFNNTI